MIHLKILYETLTLMAGTVAIFFTFQTAASRRLPVLRPIGRFLVFNNILNFANLTSAYACANLIGFCYFYQYTAFPRIFGPLARLTMMGVLYSVIQTVHAFQERALSARFKRVYAVGVFLLMLSYGIGDLFAQERKASGWPTDIQTLVFVLSVFIGMGYLARLWFFSPRIGEAGRRRAVRAFALFYFAGYSVFVLSLPLPTNVQFYPNAAVLLLFNLFPFFWVRRYFPAWAAIAASAGPDDEAVLDALAGRSGLTTREKELAGLILQGKRNDEMGKILFISPHTVKNHITRLYQKLGVSGRGGLIGLVREAGRKPPTSAGV